MHEQLRSGDMDAVVGGDTGGIVSAELAGSSGEFRRPQPALAKAVVVVIAAIVCALVLASSAAAGTATYSWTGTWSTDYGDMFLTQSGNTVTGTYTRSQARIEGTVSGSTLTGSWFEGTATGPIIFTMSGVGKSFTGKWAYAATPTALSGWDGTRDTPVPGAGDGNGDGGDGGNGDGEPKNTGRPDFTARCDPKRRTIQQGKSTSFRIRPTARESGLRAQYEVVGAHSTAAYRITQSGPGLRNVRFKSTSVGGRTRTVRYTIRVRVKIRRPPDERFRWSKVVKCTVLVKHKPTQRDGGSGRAAVDFSYSVYANTTGAFPGYVGEFQLGKTWLAGKGKLRSNGTPLSSNITDRDSLKDRYSPHRVRAVVVRRLSLKQDGSATTLKLRIRVVESNLSLCPVGTVGTVTIIDDDSLLANGQSSDGVRHNFQRGRRCATHVHGGNNTDVDWTTPPKGGPGGGLRARAEITVR